MFRVPSVLPSALLLSLSLASLPVLAAQDPGAPPPAPTAVTAPVDCGAMTCFVLRVPADGKGPELRASEAMNTINKYLGGKVGKVTTKVIGKNVRLFLNNELVVTITPGDAAAEKQKTVAALAARWSSLLAKAFEATKAQK